MGNDEKNKGNSGAPAAHQPLRADYPGVHSPVYEHIAAENDELVIAAVKPQ